MYRFLDHAFFFFFFLGFGEGKQTQYESFRLATVMRAHFRRRPLSGLSALATKFGPGDKFSGAFCGGGFFPTASAAAVLQ
ncbi:hypothetical protein F5148DRAFT_1199905 [Russula earlei]|uniref:Uncharacterized protein n=1 Tax=Russula earlei TaxID=71964 RepID=A0ACC0U912_9AGAM|nr:hypothetical protein F5148DRAFT_1199905 [Russula earlei]